jgi:hypothetical protein
MIIMVLSFESFLPFPSPFYPINHSLQSSENALHDCQQTGKAFFTFTFPLVRFPRQSRSVPGRVASHFLFEHPPLAHITVEPTVAGWSLDGVH